MGITVLLLPVQFGQFTSTGTKVVISLPQQVGFEPHWRYKHADFSAILNACNICRATIKMD